MQNTERSLRQSFCEQKIMGLHSTERNTSSGKSKSSSLGTSSPGKGGSKLSPDKVKAIKECATPENKEAVRSFLGVAVYLDSFIKNYAAIAALLCQLTRKETKFH